MIYRVKAKKGFLILPFDAENYDVYDDNKLTLYSYGEKGKLYVHVDRETEYVYIVKTGSEGYPEDKIFLDFDFKAVKYADCKIRTEGNTSVLVDGKTDSETYLFSNAEISVPFYVEVKYCYQGKGDNF
ncbi:hypothetical protein [Acidianus ambivalens]|uniref:Uncharacterized protein n=1 Tax=Acidianus ambivalens TaxID=2283 RepID=A0A650CWH4_ACIAM|nr:hypothetical protein [Acidianus ambivalens]MQL54301.1 hypothetical protein [Acidianus ambivalens]QGR22128.1 hypothetical protein D1866_09170 [Acidianus ambivalens]